ncbi:MAG: DUF5671 domain-containing protein [Caldisericota bacterium]|nr:DUF5671 domain-containing protein [Caldisericota bacterium]
MNEEKVDFWRNLFFYIASFIGLMIFIFSIVGVIGSFFSVSYPHVADPNMGKELAKSAPYIHVDVRSLINSGTGAVVGFFLWFFTWRTIQKERNII